MKAFQRYRIRFTTIVAVSTTLVLVVMAVCSYLFASNQVREQAAEQFSSELNVICNTLATQDIISHTWLTQTERNNGMLIDVASATAGSVYAEQSEHRGELTRLAREEAERQGLDPFGRHLGDVTPDSVSFRLQTGYGDFRAAVARMDAGGRLLSITVLKDMSPEQRQIDRLLLAFGAGVAAAAVCLLVLAWVFSVWAARPLEDARKMQSEFITAVSHELRSPLSVIRMNAENMEKAAEEQSYELSLRFAGKIVRECGRLSRLIGDMLRLAKADGHTWSMAFQPVIPDSILLTVIENYEQAVGEKKIKLTADMPNEPLGKVSCDSGRIEQVLTILVDNAMQYTPEGGAIRMSLSKDRRHYIFRVEDSGAGIPKEQRNKIFDRFYRGDPARSVKDHFGLGLSIAMEIIMLHRGELSVDDSNLGGVAFTVKLPV